MKNLFFILFSLLILASCSKDEPYICDNTNLGTTIIGPWTVKALGTSASIEFLEDGTLIDPEDAISGGSINDIPLTERTYSVIGDTILEIESATADGNASFAFEYPVSSYNCDQVDLEVFGIPAKFTR
jgi:hypothetical protein